MLGTITGRDVLRHAPTIVREFGPRAYVRCLAAVVSGHPRTFLAALAGDGAGAPRLRNAVVAFALAGVMAAWPAGLSEAWETPSYPDACCTGCSGPCLLPP